LGLPSKFERALGRFAIPNLALYLVVGQVAVYIAILFGRLDPNQLVLVPRLFLAGQWWRIFSFLLLPPPSSMIFICFAWWLFYFMGEALEQYWGTFHFNIFILLGVAFTIALAFLQPNASTGNAFLAGSVFLAFAYLNPDFQLSLFLILPIKIRWLALVTWLVYGYQFVVGGWSGRLQIIASVGNFLVFFGRDILFTARVRKRSMAQSAERFAASGRATQARHRCFVCGKTNITNPDMDFRYCSQCAGDECYCPEHIRNHVHVTGAIGPQSKV
jgi:hypothetical protein